MRIRVRVSEKISLMCSDVIWVPPSPLSPRSPSLAPSLSSFSRPDPRLCPARRPHKPRRLHTRVGWKQLGHNERRKSLNACWEGGKRKRSIPYQCRSFLVSSYIHSPPVENSRWSPWKHVKIIPDLDKLRISEHNKRTGDQTGPLGFSLPKRNPGNAVE